MDVLASTVCAWISTQPIRYMDQYSTTMVIGASACMAFMEIHMSQMVAKVSL
jgi:hypothetical protein